MKKKENLTAIGFDRDEELGVYRRKATDDYEPFEKKGKLGVRRRCNKQIIIIEAEFTYIEAFSIELEVLYIVGKEGKYGLYNNVYEMIPVRYQRIDMVSKSPVIFYAYTDIDKNQFDVFWARGLLAEGCKECNIDNWNVKVKYIDDQQELFDFCGNYEVNTIIKKGKYDIQLYKDYIIVNDQKPVVYNQCGCKVSEDVSGTYVRYGNYLVHVTEDFKKFYNKLGEEVNIHEMYEEVVETKEYVLVKHKGHWKVLYSV